jgi:hypothetical protein
MKKILNILLITVLLISLMSSCKNDLSNNEINIENKENIIKEDEIIKDYKYILEPPEEGFNFNSIIEFSYIPQSLDELCKSADVICEIKIKETKTKIIKHNEDFGDGPSGSIVTIAVPEILKTYKGEYNKGFKILVEGGTVSYEEYEKVVGDYYGLKGYDSSEKISDAYGFYIPKKDEVYLAVLQKCDADTIKKTSAEYTMAKPMLGLFKIKGDFFKLNTVQDFGALKKDIEKLCAENGSVVLKDGISFNFEFEEETIKNSSVEKIIKPNEVIFLKDTTKKEGYYIEREISADGFRKAIEQIVTD